MGEKNMVLASESAAEGYSIRFAANRKDAGRIVEYFRSDFAFDDRNFTPGELIQISSMPYESLNDPGFRFWFAESENREVIGVMSVRENEQKTGGYFIDYISVHREYRRQGIAERLMDTVLDYVLSQKGRYIHANTCDTDLYRGVRKLFQKKGFQQVAHLPDYYFEGEGMLTYLRKLP